MRIGERHHRGGRLQPAWLSKSAAKVLPVKLLIYAGGFPPIGGIETFIRDLSKAKPYTGLMGTVEESLRRMGKIG